MIDKEESAAKKNVQKLQRAIVDGLEDVKAQDIQVFDTEHITSLFERVIVASGTSNRQTKALAASVRDAVREAGFGKPRIEGEDNGEWIIVDCGSAVVHIMQPSIRQYYHLEELWGDKPVKLKLGAPAPKSARTASEEPAAVKVARKASGKAAAKAAAPARKAAKKATAPRVPADSEPARKSRATQAPEAKTGKPAVKTVTEKMAAPKTAAKQAPAKKAAAKKAPAKQAAAKKAPAKKAPAKTRRSA
jgi:ribosome-associated protein